MAPYNLLSPTSYLFIQLKTIVIFIVILFSSCVNNDGISSPEIVEISISQEYPLIYRINIVLDEPSPVFIRYRNETGPLMEITSENRATTHSLILSRLTADARYSVRIYAGNNIYTEEIITEPLPDDLAAIEFETTGIASYPLTLMKLYYENGYQGYGIINNEGNIVWYYRTEGRASGATRRANGNFVFIDFGIGLIEVDPAGRIVASLPHEAVGGTIHHDVITTPSDRLWFIAQNTQETTDGKIIGEAIWEWIPETGQTNKLWSSFDHLDPAVDWGPRSQEENWLHVNALSIGPRENVIISSHFLNQIISIAPDFQSIEWRLGGVNATIEVDENERFSGQHTPSENKPGHILLFDNGFERGVFSRAVEFRIEGDQAQKMWEFRPEQDNWAQIISSARRLENENTFICFGLSEEASRGAGAIEVYEVGPDGAVEWYMKAGGSIWAMYRASPVETIAGERDVSDN